MIDRSDIVAKMSLREKEVFEKYKDTYPFPMRKFLEEIDIKVQIKKEDSSRTSRENDGILHMYISKELTKNEANVRLCIMLMNIYFDHPAVDIMWGMETACTFLMPKEKFFDIAQKEFAKQSSFPLKYLAKYFAVPRGVIISYMEYLGSQCGMPPISSFK